MEGTGGELRRPWKVDVDENGCTRIVANGKLETKVSNGSDWDSVPTFSNRATKEGATLAGKRGSQGSRRPPKRGVQRAVGGRRAGPG